jgi:glucokinase
MKGTSVIHSIIAADVGGTNARFRVVKRSFDGSFREVILFKVYPVKEYDSIESILKEVTSSLKEKVEVITLAIAGVKENNCVKCTNVPQWPLVDANDLKQKFGFKQFHLLNDFEANGYATCALNVHENCAVIQEGVPDPKEPRIILGPGTGLGFAIIVYNDTAGSYTVVRAEGGHTEYTVTNEEELKMKRFAIKYLSKPEHQLTRASTERFTAGPAIPLMYEFFHQEYPELEVVCQVDPNTNKVKGSDVVIAAKSTKDPLCIKVLDQFIKNLAIFTSDMALVTMCAGGIYLTGGVSEHLADYIKSTKFLDIMHNKGRLSPFLKKIPIYHLGGTPGLDGAEQFCVQNLILHPDD